MTIRALLSPAEADQVYALVASPPPHTFDLPAKGLRLVGAIESVTLNRLSPETVETTVELTVEGMVALQ